MDGRDVGKKGRGRDSRRKTRRRVDVPPSVNLSFSKFYFLRGQARFFLAVYSSR